MTCFFIVDERNKSAAENVVSLFRISLYRLTIRYFILAENCWEISTCCKLLRVDYGSEFSDSKVYLTPLPNEL